MKFLDFTTLFEGEPASLAILSTFQFDPDFFERRILRCPSLVKARRVLVFMDATQWFKLLSQDAPAKLLNRRYLVVPVRPPHGVFHPKLHLLITQQGGQVQCGSNNLTRSGCSSNLELLNAIHINLDDPDDEPVWLAQEAFGFFKQTCDDAEEHAGRIAREWLEELPTHAPWLTASMPPSADRKVMLAHTYEGSLWERLAAILDEIPLRKLLIISPFYDLDAGLLRRAHSRWPKCEIELVVQQQTTTLPVAPMKKLRSKVTLSELRNSSRRLHAKLVAWESSTGAGCLVGSANFTTAAFDSRNVEACLLLTEPGDLLPTLFDKHLAKRPIGFEDFTPGTEQEPTIDDADSTSLRLTSALLTTDGHLRVAYRHTLNPTPTALRVAVRTPGEQRPRALFNVPNRENGTATLTPPESTLTEAHGALLASLIADTGGGREESPPLWVIQEARLTYEPSGEGSAVKSPVEDTGEGLPEFLDELGRRDGVAAVVEYLQNLNIRFNDGAGGNQGQRKFRVRPRDPFHPDEAPDWLLQAPADSADLELAIDEFVDRHLRRRLRRHAKNGNINGMENFIDIFTALVRLLYVYHVRGVIPREMVVGYLCRLLEVASNGDDEDEESEGYLTSVATNLGDSAYLQKVCAELNFIGHLRAALLIAQRVRFVQGERLRGLANPMRPGECLPHITSTLKGAMEQLGLEAPSSDDISTALIEYNMFGEVDLADLRKEILPWAQTSGSISV